MHPKYLKYAQSAKIEVSDIVLYNDHEAFSIDAAAAMLKRNGINMNSISAYIVNPVELMRKKYIPENVKIDRMNSLIRMHKLLELKSEIEGKLPDQYRYILQGGLCGRENSILYDTQTKGIVCIQFTEENKPNPYILLSSTSEIDLSALVSDLTKQIGMQSNRDG